MTTRADRVVGLVPAAGFGSRLSPIPCSKEILPIGMWPLAEGGARPKVLGHYLLERFAAAGIERAVWVVSQSKPDIERYFRQGEEFGLHLEYAVTENTPGTPFTLDVAYPHIEGATVALGFPDILVPECQAYERVLNLLDASGADIALGLFPTDQPSHVDLVELQADSSIAHLMIKPDTPPPDALTWAVAVWRPSFSHFMHVTLEAARDDPEVMLGLLDGAQKNELYVGDVLNLAIADGLRVVGVHLSDEPSLDVGTPAGWMQGAAQLARQPIG